MDKNWKISVLTLSGRKIQVRAEEDGYYLSVPETFQILCVNESLFKILNMLSQGITFSELEKCCEESYRSELGSARQYILDNKICLHL
jgi:hypothetical protein